MTSSKGLAAGLLLLASLAPVAARVEASAAQGNGARLVIEDIAGDANGLNSQGEYGFGDLEAPTTPASIDEADLLKVSLRVPSSGKVTLTFETAAPVASGFAYTITAELGNCRVSVRHERVDDARTVINGCGFDGKEIRGQERIEGTRLSIHIPGSVAADIIAGSRHRAETQALVDLAGRPFTPLFLDTAAP